LDEEDLRNAIQCLVDDIHIFEAREAAEGEDLDELYASYDAKEARIQSALEEGLIHPAVLTAEQPRVATVSETAGSTPGIQQLKRGRNGSSEERASRSASPMTDPKGEAPATKTSTRKSSAVHPTTRILEPVKPPETPRRSARLMSGQVSAGNQGTTSSMQAIAGEQELQLRPSNHLPGQPESRSGAPPKKKAKTPTKKARK
jgi:hypothetical protein